MNLQQERRHAAVEVRGLPRLDRFFPDCALGLVELYAGRAYGLRDLKKIWFGNTFNYERHAAGGWLRANRVEFAGTFSLDGDVRGKAFEALRRYYGIRSRSVSFDDFGAILDEVHATLTRGVSALSAFDMWYLQSEGRSNGRVDPHMIGIFAIDPQAGTLRAMDQVRVGVTIPLSQYAESLVRFSQENPDFFFLKCERDGDGDSLPLDRDGVLRDVRAAVANAVPNQHSG
jgi:hypothetical protein